MDMFKAIDISASGLTAQRMRMDTISNNLANVDSTRTESGGPYRRQVPIFEARQDDSFDSYLNGVQGGSSTGGNGVRVVGISEDPSPFLSVYDPGNPDADATGYVKKPNVNSVNEMVDMISATRSFEANATAINSAKQMITKALDIGK